MGEVGWKGELGRSSLSGVSGGGTLTSSSNMRLISLSLISPTGGGDIKLGIDADDDDGAVVEATTRGE